MLGGRVDERRVDLVDDDARAVRGGQLADRRELGPRVDGAGRVVGVAQKQRTAPPARAGVGERPLERCQVDAVLAPSGASTTRRPMWAR